MVQFPYAVSKTAIICTVSMNLTKKQSKGVQLELLYHQFKFHPEQMNSVRENETNRFYFVLTLWPLGTVKVSESGIKW